MAQGTQQLSGPPPSPVLDDDAAAESNPMAAASMRGLAGPDAASMTAGAGAAAPPLGAGPDQSGLMQLGQKLSEGILTLAQAAPEIANEMNQCDQILKNALAKILETAAGTGTSSAPGGPGAPGAPGAAPPMGAPPAPVTQTGTQYPGGGFGKGRPF